MERSNHRIPKGSFPLLPLRNGVLFPGVWVTLPVGRERSVRLVRNLSSDSVIGLAVQRDPQSEDPGPSDLHPIGVLAHVHRIIQQGDFYQLAVEGFARFKLVDVTRTEPFFLATGEIVDESNAQTEESQALAEGLKESLQKLVASAEGRIKIPEDLPTDPGLLADKIAASLNLPTEEELEVLFTLDVSKRLRLVARLIGQTVMRSEVKQNIDQELKRSLSNQQREAYLREQLKAIKKELGDSATDDEEMAKLRKRIEEAGLPDDAKKIAQRELDRLEAMSRGQAEHGVIRRYLELIADLPWQKRAEINQDIPAIEKQLNLDHYGLEEPKKRILEHMAVASRIGHRKGTILCFAGPPGVGKTSLGQSIATATKRPFVRIALGGVRDEAEIRGHRRTYVGALPGRIIAAMKKAGVKNPVILLDEIDKLSKGWSGDPEAALLEVLDPEQNHTFTDHYLELSFDLSEVMFLCTANALENISAPLRDRLEIIEVSGYTSQEKLHITKDHLLPKQLEEHGLVPETLALPDATVLSVIQNYTREAGVRQLKRMLQKVCRAVTLEILRQPDRPVSSMTIEETDLHKYLGKQRFFNEVAERTSIPGVATGMAWTPTGGEILFIESTRMTGKGRLEITGKLGDVMQESARAALTFVRSHAESLGVPVDFMERYDIHIHVPAGAIPKDGPSAGVTMATALTSLLTGRKVRPDTAMTGEISLRGRVLPVGGIKEKLLAAHRAGLSRIILPHRNERDLDEIPKEVLEHLDITLAENLMDVFEAALEPADVVLTALPSLSESIAQSPQA